MPDPVNIHRKRYSVPWGRDYVKVLFYMRKWNLLQFCTFGICSDSFELREDLLVEKVSFLLQATRLCMLMLLQYDLDVRSCYKIRFFFPSVFCLQGGERESGFLTLAYLDLSDLNLNRTNFQHCHPMSLWQLEFLSVVLIGCQFSIASLGSNKEQISTLFCF